MALINRNILNFICLSIAIMSSYHHFAQNIVANHNFVDINKCTEHNATCAPEAWLLASPNIPLHKNGEVGIVVLNSSAPNIRQYVQTELLMEMEANKEYKISIRFRADDCIINSIGVKLSDAFVCLEKDQLLSNASFDFSKQLSNIKKKKQRKWMELDYIYKAQGGEKFILIGCFNSDKSQERSFKKNPLPYKNYYYFFDKIDVIPTYLDTLPSESEYVQKHLYNFNYRHSFCRYTPYQKIESIITDTILAIEDTPQIDSIILGDVLFDFNSDSLKKESKDEILLRINTIQIKTLSTVNVYGYTDSIGNDQYNIELSQKRADAVKQFLIDLGVPKEIISSIGMGSKNPIADNKTEEGRSKNRRIELIFKYH